ncbi:MAG: aminopeptidase [Anaerolineae bacterium UTCFX2]|jgi:endoglucanase|nr:M20/M25/M40 family metallo-hydrolase [Anaerolineales bacterium]OQY89905.1 MAG: aminopeptidase [Anaerolineae bacterium UTCFX2]
MKSLLKKLSETPAPPGYETAVRAIIKEEILPFVDEIQVDNLGNLIARKGTRAPNGLRIMLAAHMDEIGLIVTHVDEQGFARFSSLGGLARASVRGARVQFLNGAFGVIGFEHSSDAGRLPPFEQMFIDLGAASRAECPVRVGDLAVFERGLIEIGSRLVGKALDDRVGVALLIELLRQLTAQAVRSPHELYFVFSAQEEIGSRGAAVAAYQIEPDLGLAIDLTASGGTPKGLKMAVELGCGPAIKVRDQLTIADPRLVSWAVDVAQHAGLPYQLEILERGSTDARAIQLARSGVPVSGISIPARYVHSPSEMVDAADLQNALLLLLAMLSQPLDLH